MLRMTRLDYNISETRKKKVLEYGPCVSGPVRDELIRENNSKLYANSFDTYRPLVSGPAPEFHDGVRRKPLIWRFLILIIVIK